MANPLMQFLGGTSGPSMPSPMGNVMQLLRQFQQFRSAFQGDPKKQVEELHHMWSMAEDLVSGLCEAVTKERSAYMR